MHIDISSIRQLERQKGLSFDKILEVIQTALVAAYKKTSKSKSQDISSYINPKTGEFHIFEDGKDVTPADFARTAAEEAKKVIMSSMKTVGHKQVLEFFQKRLNTILIGVIQNTTDKGNVYIEINGLRAILPLDEQVAGESYEAGKRIKVYISEVYATQRGPKVIVSRAVPGFIKELFRSEVPEMQNNIVDIVSVSRDAGQRSKVAVLSYNAKISGKGALIGDMGARVKAVCDEIGDEKIDIIDYSDNIAQYAANAISPAKAEKYEIVDKDENTVDVYVSPSQLSLAIGADGRNVSLAARLTGAKIDIKTI